MQGQDRLETLAFPDRDPSFRALIARLSEPETGKSADNFVSNEDSYPRIASLLASKAPAGSVYLGVGPDQNFTLMAHAKSRLAFVLDFRRRNLRLHLIHKALCMLASNRLDYLSRLTARSVPGLSRETTSIDEIVKGFQSVPVDPTRLAGQIQEVRTTLEPLGVVGKDEWSDLATIQTRLAGPGIDARFLALAMYPTFGHLMKTTDRLTRRPAHWLAEEKTFARVQQLQKSDRVVPLVADLAGQTALRSLADWLKEHRLSVGVVYVSDVEFFLMRAVRFEAYLSNLRTLPWAEGALIVRTSTREIAHPERVPGDSSTTIVRPVQTFLDRASSGRVKTLDHLFE